jgi:hypothetical protein
MSLKYSLMWNLNKIKLFCRIKLRHPVFSLDVKKKQEYKYNVNI